MNAYYRTRWAILFHNFGETPLAAARLVGDKQTRLIKLPTDYAWTYFPSEHLNVTEDGNFRGDPNRRPKGLFLALHNC